MTRLTLPDSVETITAGALRNCAQLTELNCGKGLKSLGGNALAGCMSLKVVRLNGSAIIEPQGIPALADLTVHAPVGSPAQAYAEENGIRFVPVISWAITLPKNVVEIQAQAFMGTVFTTVYCPNGLTTIGDEAFASSALTFIRLPASVTRISSTAFANLPALVIIAPAGSPAQSYAEQMDLAFIAE